MTVGHVTSRNAPTLGRKVRWTPSPATFVPSTHPYHLLAKICEGLNSTTQLCSLKPSSLNVLNCLVYLIHVPWGHYGLFTLPNSESDSDSKPKGYIVLDRSFHIGSDLDPDPYSDLHLNLTTFQPGDQSPNLN